MKKGIVILLIILIIVIACTVIIAVINNNSNGNNKENAYTIEYLGVDITPGNEFKEEEIDDTCTVFGVTSCAFDGTDDIYEYSGVEITVAHDGDKDVIYSVLLKENVETTEGVQLGDESNKITEIYGNSYESDIENEYIYTSEDERVILTFITDNDQVVSIEYLWNIL